MGWWSNLFNGMKVSLTDTNKQLTAKVRAQGIQFFEVNGVTQWVSLENSIELKEAYQKCAPLSSIVAYMGKAFSDAKVEILQARNDNYVRGQYKEWDKFMERPNSVQNGVQFLKQLYIYTRINGFAIIYHDAPAGFKGTGIPPKNMWVLPYWLVDIQESGKRMYDMTGEYVLNNLYFLDGYGNRTKLNKDNIILIRDTTGEVDDRFLLPISRVCLNRYPISTLISAAEAEITMIQNRGATGILSNQSGDVVGTTGMDEDEKKDLQAEFAGYGLTRQQRQVIITNANLSWQAMNFPTKDLMLHESYAKCIKDLCDAYGMPFELLAHSDRKNLANVNTFDKILYQNSIIPDANDISQQLTVGYGLDKLQTPIYIHFDYSGVAAMQKSEEEKGKGLEAMYGAYQKAWDLGTMTRNDIREAMGMDRLPEEEFDQYKWQTAEVTEAVKNTDNGTDKPPVQK